jgi:hypothetical protein
MDEMTTPPQPPKHFRVRIGRRSWSNVVGWSFTDGGAFTFTTSDGAVYGKRVPRFRPVRITPQ